MTEMCLEVSHVVLIVVVSIVVRTGQFTIYDLSDAAGRLARPSPVAFNYRNNVDYYFW